MEESIGPCHPVSQSAAGPHTTMVLTGKASHLPVRLISSVEISKHKLCKSLVIIHSV